MRSRELENCILAVGLELDHFENVGHHHNKTGIYWKSYCCVCVRCAV